MDAGYTGPERRRTEIIRRRLIWAVLALLMLLTASSLYGAFIVSPNERDDIRETADAVSKSNAGVTALICTGTNRHDAIDTSIVNAILPGTRIFDRQNGTNLTAPLEDALKDIPPSTNCGELICQFFREIEEPGAEIVIEDPFGPDRPKAPCGETTAGAPRGE